MPGQRGASACPHSCAVAAVGRGGVPVAAPVVPTLRAPAGGDYTQLTQANRGSAGFCYDIATLLPQYNPLAVPIPTYIDPQDASVSATSVSTLLVFGEAFGEPGASRLWLCCQTNGAAEAAARWPPSALPCTPLRHRGGSKPARLLCTSVTDRGVGCRPEPAHAEDGAGRGPERGPAHAQLAQCDGAGPRGRGGVGVQADHRGPGTR